MALLFVCVAVGAAVYGGPALPAGLRPKKKYDHAAKTKRLNWVKIPANKARWVFWGRGGREGVTRG